VTTSQDRSYPNEEQPTEILTEIHATGRGDVALRLLDDVELRELPDARLTTLDRLMVKLLARVVRHHLSSYQLYHLAGAVEAEAHDKWAEELSSD